MSHANGTATFEDGTIYYCEYDGTTDIFIPDLYESYEEMHANWRKADRHNPKKCTCGADEPVTLFNDYGKGYEWEGRACRQCMVITKGLRDDEDELIEADMLFSPTGRLEPSFDPLMAFVNHMLRKLSKHHNARGRRVMKNNQQRRIKKLFPADFRDLELRAMSRYCQEPDHCIEITEANYNRFMEQEANKVHCVPNTCHGQCQGMSDCGSRTTDIFQTYLDRNEED